MRFVRVFLVCLVLLAAVVLLQSLLQAGRWTPCPDIPAVREQLDTITPGLTEFITSLDDPLPPPPCFGVDTTTAPKSQLPSFDAGGILIVMGRSETTSTLHWRSTDVGRGPGPGNAETAVALLHYLAYFGHKTFLYGYQDVFHDLCFKAEYNHRVLPTVADVLKKYQAGDIKIVISLDWSMDDYLGSKAFFLDQLKGVFLIGLFDGFHDFNRTRANLYAGMFFQDYLKVMRWKEMGMQSPAFRSSFGFIRHPYHHTKNRTKSVIFLGRMRASSKISMLCKCAKEDLGRTFYFTLASGKDRPPPRDSSDAMKKHCTSRNVVYLDRNKYSNEDIQNLVENAEVGIDFSWPGWHEHHTNSKVLNYIRNGLVPVVELPSQYAPVAVRYGGILVPQESDCATWTQAFDAASRRMTQAKPFLKIVGGHMTNWPSISPLW